MGNTLLATQKIACGHTDRLHIRQNLLCDRLSQPTAEMVDAFIFLQDHKADLRHIGETLTQQTQRRHATKELMLATCFCIFFEYLPIAEMLETFSGVLSRPDDFLEDLMKLRAQGDKIFRLQPLIHEVDINGTDSRGVLDSLSAFARAALESAQIYSEIRDAAEAGQLDRQQAANLLDCIESDQRRSEFAWQFVEPTFAFQIQENGKRNGHPRPASR
eukprot:symbB.v1.2.022378.t1/scaffold1984.1/size115852/5